MQLPTRASYVVIGAGVHGLSTAWHLAKESKARRRGSGEDVIVLDKTGVGAGASGIACGVIRNNYFQPAMRQLMAHSVSIWESDPEAFAYHPVGYMQISPEVMQSEGVQIYTGVRVTGLRLESGAVSAVETDRGTVRCEHLVVGIGPWIRDIWKMLDLPGKITVKGPDGELYRDREMWTYWSLQEGVLGVEPSFLTDNGGDMPPVIHVDTDAPLHDENGELITDELWGIYYKPDFYFNGVQGGATPYVVDQPADEVAVDPYGPESPDFVVGEDFARMWTSALAHCHERFEGKGHHFSKEPSGGIGCFTPDSFPVFDTFRQNAYVIADSNHGYKMIGVGALVAKELMDEPQGLLEPFRFSRYETGELHPTSNSPFPWS